MEVSDVKWLESLEAENAPLKRQLAESPHGLLGVDAPPQSTGDGARLTEDYCSNKGPEFVGETMLNWAHERIVNLRQIDPGKLNENADIKSVNGGLRHKCLNEH